MFKKRYNTIYVDIDHKRQIPFNKINKFVNIGWYEVIWTKKGAHIRINIAEKGRTKDEVISFLCSVRADYDFIKRFVETNTQTLFTVRRGKYNNTHLWNAYILDGQEVLETDYNAYLMAQQNAFSNWWEKCV